MALVVDSSLMVDALQGPCPARDRITGVALAAPHLIDIEVGNALRKLVVRGVISDDFAAAVVVVDARFEISRYSHTGLIERAWQLRHNLTISDAVYVALAEALELPLVTSDARMARAPGLRCSVEVVPLGG